MDLGPMLVRPRLDTKPWGGDRLRQYGFASPGAEPLGEAVMTAGEAVLETSGGITTLDDAVTASPADWLGRRGLSITGGRPRFPLRIKLLDASHDLSVQVHPDDTMARAFDSLGKTEAWHVLHAEPGASLWLGPRPGVG